MGELNELITNDPTKHRSRFMGKSIKQLYRDHRHGHMVLQCWYIYAT